MSFRKRHPISVQLLSKQVKHLIDQGKRIDGRNFHSFRQIRIKTRVIENADGSAYVELGNTVVVAGVKFEIGTPFPDTPDEGILIVEGEVLPLASIEAEPGPPTEDEIELSRVVDRGIRESKMLNLKELAIKPGEKVLKVFVDFNVINDAGNVIDASNLATVSALLTAKCPNLEELKVSNSTTIKDVTRVPLPIYDVPVSITFANLFGKLVVDPTTEEEAVMLSRLTITLTKDDRICAIQKGEKGTLSFDQILEALEIAKKVSHQVRKKILDATGIKQKGAP